MADEVAKRMHAEKVRDSKVNRGYYLVRLD